MNALFHSLRWRLQIWHALILFVVIGLLCVLTYRLVASHRWERIDRELESFERAFIRRIWETPGSSQSDGRRLSPEEIHERFRNLDTDTEMPIAMRHLFDPAASSSTYLIFWQNESSVLFRSANVPAGETIGYPPASERRQQARTRDHFRELVRGGPQGFRGIVGRDISADRTALHQLAWQISASGFTLWLLGLLGGWWLAGRAIRPIEEISRTASSIADGDLAERIEITDSNNELGRLSHVLNDTFDRLETALQRQRQFTADASHELRTPLTIILSETTRGLKRDRTEAEYRDILSNCRLAATRMKSLVEDLLILARQDGNPGDHAREPCDLSLITSDAIRLLSPLAAERNITLTSDLKPAPLIGETRSLSMVVGNLISNAIEHQDPGGAATIRVFQTSQETIMEVTDSGPGIPEEHLPRIFDRFYRVDSSRNAKGGHSGLGLPIAQTIVISHGGTLTAESQPGLPTIFRVTFPIPTK